MAKRPKPSSSAPRAARAADATVSVAGAILRVLGTILLIVLPVALLFAEGSYNNMQSVAIIAALPISVVLILCTVSFIKDGRHYLKEEKDAQVIDDITWEDIEMDEVFFRVNHTRSYMGEQILYHMLHLIKKDKSTIDEEADFFDKDEEVRVETEMNLRSLSKRYSKYYLLNKYRL